MFDLTAALENWRRPFEASHLYSSAEIDELESHLLDALEHEQRRGAGLAEAFWSSVASVGDEHVLRDAYLAGWKGTNPVSRLWKGLRTEGRCFSSRRARIVYGVSRVLSLAVGVGSFMYLAAFGFFMARGARIWAWGDPVYQQGILFTFLLGMMGVFTWLPFKPWSGKLYDWIRLVYIASITYMGTAIMYYWVGLSSASVPELLLMLGGVYLGPVLWVAQVLIRRRYLAACDGLLFDSD